MKYKVTLNGTTYEVEVEHGQAMLIDEYAAIAPAAAAVTASGEVGASPMPGVILNVKVTQGQVVKKGDVLIILEAMKMENEISAPKDGTVAQIVTAKGANVDTGAPLIVLQ